jgi:3-phosphoglycerate kinase
MKLAEALILRSDYQKRVEQLKQRLLQNVRIQEGDEPNEEPKVLKEELAELEWI